MHEHCTLHVTRCSQYGALHLAGKLAPERLGLLSGLSGLARPIGPAAAASEGRAGGAERADRTSTACAQVARCSQHSALFPAGARAPEQLGLPAGLCGQGPRIGLQRQLVSAFN